VLTLYTGSRGGLVALTTMFVLFTVLRTAKVRMWHKAFLLLTLVGLAWFNLDRINVERYRTIGNLGQDYNLSDEFGRSQLWQRGFQIFLRHPLTGVGADNFGEAVGTMRSQENVTPYWQAPHNSYVQVLAETGLFGTVTFVALIVTSMATFNRLRRNAAGASRDFTALPGLLFVGFCALLVSASFLTQAYSVFFTLYFAVAGAVPVIAGLPAPGAERRA
jgi:O-antigen ligase